MPRCCSKRYQWRKVHVPKIWNPREVGEELVGFYGGRTLRNGSFGQYEIVVVHVPLRGSYTVSGTALIQLLDCALVAEGHPIRIVWRGRRCIAPGKEKKEFDLLVAEGDPIEPAALPVVKFK